MGWYRHVADSVYLALCAVFGVDPQSADGLKRFVPAYIEDATNAQAPRDMDICYFALSEVQDSSYNYIQLKDIVAKNVPKVSLKKTIPVQVLLTFYGNNADDDAEKFWSEFQWDSGYGCARQILRSRNIVPLEKPARPLSLFEMEGTYHRRRSDVRLYLAYLEITDKEVGYVVTPPDFTIDTQE